MLDFAFLAFQSGPSDLAELSCAAILLALLVWSLVWVANDAEARGKSGCLVALLVLFLSWPLSLLVWIIFRPERR
jgi:drug/metabolite transporter (DMT)-like permease